MNIYVPADDFHVLETLFLQTQMNIDVLADDFHGHRSLIFISANEH